MTDLPGEDVGNYMTRARIEIARDFKRAILSIMNSAPSPDDSSAGMYATDVIDEVLAALVEYTDTSMIADRLQANEAISEALFAG